MDTIIVGVDDSVPSRAAIRWGIDQARLFDASLLLVHVIDDEAGTVGAALVEELGSAAPALLERELAFARSLDPTATIGIRLLTGSPMWELAQFSAPNTLVVVGTHKSGFHYGRAFGSRSLQLASLAEGAVAVIPERVMRSRQEIIVGVDDTDAGREALEAGADLAVARAAELTLVRASIATIPFGLTGDDRQDWQLRRDDVARDALRLAMSRVRIRHPALTTRSRIVRRTPGAALNDLARAADILVIGDSRRTDESAPGALGSVAYDVLLNATSPTILVHAPRVAPIGMPGAWTVGSVVHSPDP